MKIVNFKLKISVYSIIISNYMDSKRILLVEDDLLLQKLYSDLLTSEHYYVETATDGMIAYQKMKEGGWDLVLLDIILPKLGGIEIVKKLKDEKNKKIKKKNFFFSNFFY